MIFISLILSDSWTLKKVVTEHSAYWVVSWRREVLKKGQGKGYCCCFLEMTSLRVTESEAVVVVVVVHLLLRVDSRKPCWWTMLRWQLLALLADDVDCEAGDWRGENLKPIMKRAWQLCVFWEISILARNHIIVEKLTYYIYIIYLLTCKESLGLLTLIQQQKSLILSY